MTFRIKYSVIYSSLSVSPITYCSLYQETHPPGKSWHSRCSMVPPLAQKGACYWVCDSQEQRSQGLSFQQEGPPLGPPHHSCFACLRLPVIKSRAGRGLSGPPVQLAQRHMKGLHRGPPTQHTDWFLYNTEEGELGAQGCRERSNHTDPSARSAQAIVEWHCSTFLKRHPASSFLQCPSILSNSSGFPSPPKFAITSV